MEFLPLQPHSMELKVEWNGETACAMTCRVIVMVQARPSSSLTILKKVENLDAEPCCKIDYLGQKTPNEEIKTEIIWHRHHSSKICRQGPSYLLNEIVEKDDSVLSKESTCEEEDSSGTIRAIENENSIKNEKINHTPKPSKIPKRKFDMDGSFDDSDDVGPPEESSTSPEKAGPQDLLFGDDLGLDLPPSPTPSSQDQIPWASTKEISSFLEDDEKIHTPEKENKRLWHLVATAGSEILDEDGDYVFYVYEHADEGIYRAEIIMYRYCSEETEGWHTLDLSDIISSCPSMPGKIVFLELPDDGTRWEFKICGLDGVHGSAREYQAHFDPRDRPLVFFRIRERWGVEYSGECLPKQVSGKEHVDEKEATDEGPQELSQISDIGEPGDDAEIRDEPDTANVMLDAQLNDFKGSFTKTPKQQVKYALQQLIPALFLTTFLFTVIFGSPEAISTPTKTFQMVSEFGTYLRVRGHDILQAYTNMSTEEMNIYQRSLSILDHYLIDLGTNSLAEPILDEVYTIHGNTSTVLVVDETSGKNDTAEIQDPEKCLVLKSSSMNMYEALGIFCYSTMLDEHLSSDSTSSTEELLKAAQTTVQRPSRQPPSTTLGTSLLSLTKSIFRHIACSTSAACTIGHVSDYQKNHEWEIVERYYCDKNSDWRLSTFRDRFDHLLGWMPPKCREE